MKNLQWNDQNPGVGNIVSQAKAGPLNYAIIRNMFVSHDPKTGETVADIDYRATVNFASSKDVQIVNPISEWTPDIDICKEACQNHYNEIQNA